MKLQDIREWPISSRALFGLTPEQVKNMNKEQRTSILSRHNLEITQAELAKCREAIRNGKIWQLAEERSHSSPQLRVAFLWVLEQLAHPDEGPIGDCILDIISSTNPVRKGGENMSHDIELRPHILHSQALIATRWKIPGSWWDNSKSSPKKLIIIEKSSPPWRLSSLDNIISYLIETPNSIPLILTPLGIIPYSLEDLSPWCHLDGDNDMWNIEYDDEEILDFLSELKIRNWLDRCSIVDKLSVLCSINPNDGCKLTSSMTSRKSNTDRMVNVYSQELHILSPRLNDGGISLTVEGAKKLLDNRIPNSFEDYDIDSEFLGLPKVCINDDAKPFVGIGRNVMHGYILAADSHIIPGQPCLIVDSDGHLIAHGIALTSSKEMNFFKKGIAVKVRDGVLKNNL